MSTSLRMPRAMLGSDPIEAINKLAASIEQQLAQTRSGRPYLISNGVGARSLNVSTAAASDVAKVLGTLVGDLQQGGIIG